jgi:GT2 family glycosyltransferase
MGTGPVDTLAEHAAGIAASRAALLSEIGEGYDLTFVTGPGNVGDALIQAGIRALLSGRIYREITVDQLPRETGHTALMTGGGAWCRAYHEYMPRALGIAEARFERVIVLPSSFDVTEDIVRQALERSAATIFAREHESLHRIEGMCRARLAHDCAFFFDFTGFATEGTGTLNAFRLDGEALPGEPDMPDNDDLSVTAGDLGEWLATIERHAHIRTDHLHVLIAAALMGKTVEYASSSYFKTDAIAESWLEGLPVTRIDPPRRRRPADPVATLRERLRAVAARSDHARAAVREGVTAVVLTRDQVEHAETAVASVLRAGEDVKVLLIANNSGAASRERLERLAASEPRVELRLLDRNLGCAGGRRLASELVRSELMLFIDDDAELIDGALEHLRADLAAHRDAIGVTALVVGPDGLVQHCGGTFEWSDETVRFRLGGNGLPYDDPAVPATGRSDWIPGTVALIRSQALREIPIDPAIAFYYEDNDWSFRAQRARPGSLRRCREAIALHHGGRQRLSNSCQLAQVFDIVELLSSQAAFLARNGVVLDVDLAARLPQLTLESGAVDIAAVRVLLGLVSARGVEWVASEWLGGGLAPLFEPALGAAMLRESLDARARELATTAAAHAELAEYVGLLQRENAEQEEKVRWLLGRHELLTRLEHGRYLQLRRRLGPAIRMVARARTAIDEARSR